MFVADESDQIVGSIHVCEMVSLDSDPYGEILVVDEAHRGHRVGEQLVAAAEGWMGSKGLRRIRVRSIVIRERARRFYERRDTG